MWGHSPYPQRSWLSAVDPYKLVSQKNYQCAETCQGKTLGAMEWVSGDIRDLRGFSQCRVFREGPSEVYHLGCFQLHVILASLGFSCLSVLGHKKLPAVPNDIASHDDVQR